MTKVYKFASVINSPIDTNTKNKRFDWKYTNHAVKESLTGKVGTDWAYSTYKKTSTKNKKGKVTTTYKIPHILTAHSFNLDIPSGSYIDKVTVIADWKISKGVTVKAPNLAFMVYGGNGKVTNAKSGKTGWHNGLYYVYPKNNLSTKFTKTYYTISGKEWNKKGYPTNRLNQAIFGVDFYFNTPSKMTVNQGFIYLNYVQIKVEYTKPQTKLYYSIASSRDNPYNCIANKPFDLNVTVVQNKGDGGTKTIPLDIPFGTEIYTTSPQNPITFRASPHNKKTYKYTLKSSGIGLKQLIATLDNVKYSFYYLPLLFGDNDYFKTHITSDELHKGHLGCFTFNIESESTTTEEIFDIEFSNPMKYVNITLDEENSSDGIEILSCTTNDEINYRVTCKVNTAQLNTIKFDLCVYPRDSGYQSVRIHDFNENEGYKYVFTCLDPYTYHISSINDITDTDYYIRSTPEVRKFECHHAPTEVDSQGIFFNCTFQDGDDVMIMKQENLTLHYYDKVAYIGCVPLEHSHYDPKSDYKDGVLTEKNKNKKYVGKKLQSEEDISLNIKVRPKQITTLQGLVDMDKPIPVNTVPEAFESDALNHRGWAEIYGVKNVKKTNNHWYECEVDLEYLTHNLNTRFKVIRGGKTYPVSIPSITYPVLRSGDELLGYFNVDTDGTYRYNEDYTDENGVYITFEDNQRNFFQLESGQSLKISSKEKLKNCVNIVCDWSTAKLSEDKENLVTRIFRIRGDKGVLFEYEYTDFDFTDPDYISCRVIGRQLRNGSYDPLVIDKVIDLNIVDDSDVDEDTGEVIVDGEADIYFGSKFHLELVGKQLNIIDEGFNGKEVSVTLEDELDGSDLFFEMEFANHNADLESNEVSFYVDYEVNDAVIDTARFYDKYDKMIVSPFPVADDHRLLFIREAQEGIIYYYEENEFDEFSYVIDPYYQYKNGTDLTVEDSQSIFSLNYGYNPVFIENGLVRLGFNRLSGRLYLSKWDNESQSYIEICRLHLANEKDVDLSYISDDKIVLTAGDSNFTIWRGHPYIMINHSKEDIYIDTDYYRAYGESVGDNVSEYPVYWDLLNTNNLLPKEYGGNKLDTTNLVFDDKEEVAHCDLVLSSPVEEISVGADAMFNVTGTFEGVDIELPYSDGYTDDLFGTFNFETLVDETVVYPPLFMISSYNDDKNNKFVKVNVCAFDGTGISGKAVEFYLNDKLLNTGEILSDLNGEAIIQVNGTGQVYAKWNDVISNKLEV